GLQKGNVFKAAVEPNPHFHFPKKAAPAVLIANGTGIAPFLGMLDEHQNVAIKLLWGGRFANSFNIYENILKNERLRHRDISFHKCFSREAGKQYVQDLVLQQSDTIIETLDNDGTVMICGSLSMQH